MKQVTLRNGMVAVRVSREQPCRVCGKDSWCLHLHGGGSICQRVESDHEVVGAGWLHLVAGAEPVRVEAAPNRPADVTGMTRRSREYQCKIRPEHVANLVREIGVDAAALHELEVGWDGRAYTFPMRNGDGQIIGIRKRMLDGAKWAEEGSRSGLFISEDGPMDWLLLPEGPTDSAAAVEMGFAVWGRPDAKSGGAFARKRLSRLLSDGVPIHEVVVVGDADGPGAAGAEGFAAQIADVCPCGVRVWCPPVQGLDFREFVDLLGSKATRDLFVSLFKATEVRFGL